MFAIQNIYLTLLCFIRESLLKVKSMVRKGVNKGILKIFGNNEFQK